MKQVSFSLVIIVFLFCSLFSCKPSSPHPGRVVLNYADSLLEICPDSALSFLRSLSIEDYPEEEQVLHGLLLTSAMDKNFLSLLPCDSLIDTALDYYEKGDGYNRARALLYKERIQFLMNMPEEAMANCFEALSEIDNRDSRGIKLRSMLYDDLGNWYLEQMIDEKALEMFKKSYYNDSLINDRKGMAYSLRNMSNVYTCINKPDSAAVTLKKIQGMLPEFKDSLFVSNLYRDLSNNEDDKEAALAYAHQAVHILPAYADSSSFLYSLGEMYQNIYKLDSADFYFKKALKGDIKMRTLASLSLAEMAKEKGDYQLSSDYYSNYVDLIDSIFAANQASNIERLAYKYEAKAENLKKEKQMQQSIFLIVFIFVIVIFVGIIIVLIVLRKRKIAQLIYEKEVIHLKDKLIIMQSNIAKTEAEIEVLRQVHSENQEKIREKEILVSKMIDEKAELRNMIFSKTSIYQLIYKLSKQDRKDKKTVRVLNTKEQKLLKETIFDIYGEYVNYLRTTYTKMSEDDCLYCCLQLCKFDDYTIAYCFGNTNKQIVVQRRFRLKEKMANK